MSKGNPQLEDGHLRLANELVEQFAKHNIPGTEMRIVWAIWRKTWCWKDKNRRKDTDWISITQFEKATSMKRASVHRSIKSLLAKRLILVSQKANGRLYYGFNKRYNEWVLVKRLTLVKRLRVVSQKANAGVSQKAKYKEQYINSTTVEEKTTARILKILGMSSRENLLPSVQELLDKHGEELIKRVAMKVSLKSGSADSRWLQFVNWCGSEKADKTKKDPYSNFKKI